MDLITRVLSELHRELDQIDQAILSLRQLEVGRKTAETRTRRPSANYKVERARHGTSAANGTDPAD